MKPALVTLKGLGRVVPIAGGPPPRTRPRHRLVIALLAAAGVATLGIAVDLARRVSVQPPPLLVVAPITRGLVVATVKAEGTLEPLLVTTLAQPIAGRLLEVRARPGDQVLQGQLLARFDSLALRAELARAEARLVGAEVASFEAELQLRRVERLLPENRREALPEEEDEDDVQDLYQVTAARLAQAAADLAAREAVYKLARRRVKDGEVRAPSNGTVLARFVEGGEVLPAGAPLFKLAGAGGQLQLAASVGEAEAGALKLGQPVEFTVPAYAGRKFSGQVVALPPLAGVPSPRRQPVMIGISSDQAGLRPGMTGTAWIRTASEGVTARVPSAALLFAPGTMTGASESPSLWLVDETNQLRQVPVEVRLRDGDFAEVRGEGLREGVGVALGYARRP